MINGTKNDIKVVQMSRYQIWWNNRTKTQKKCVYALVGFIGVVFFFLFFYFMFTVEPNVCTTSRCVRTSMEILNHIDKNMEPCNDFYRFACGSFVLNTNLDTHGSRSVQDNMEDEIQSQIKALLESELKEGNFPAYNVAKKFYRSCMNESSIQKDGLKKTKLLFKQIGGWPTLDGTNWREEQFDWKKSVYRLRRVGIHFEIFFTMNLETDKKDASKYILSIGDPFYSPSELSNNVRTMYLDYMVDVAVLFGANVHKAKTDSIEVLNLLLKLSQISEDVDTENRTRPQDTLLSLSELQYQYGSIPWYQFISNILSPMEKITYDDVVRVVHPIYLKRVEQLLHTTPNRTLANFICWQTLQQLINYLPAEILDRAYEYLGKVDGKVARKPRWYMCVKAVQDRMNPVISAAYVEEYFDEETRHRVIEIIRNIKTEFKRTLLKLNWLDGRTKHMAIEKLLTSVEEIVPYRDIVDSIEQSTIYDYADVKENEFLNSALSLDIINLNYKFGKLRQRVQDSWIRDRGFVTGLNIIFSPKENVLRFPVGLLRGIYYQTDRPNYMNYGILGSIIAHEISHIFVQAEYRDLMGELRSWWSTHSLLNYDEKLQCLSNQYGKFVIPELGKHLNSSNTRDEDLADLAGMKVAYDTYINLVEERGPEPILPGLQYTPNQLFWISSAIRHCSKFSTETLQKYVNNYHQSPKQFRVNGPLQNLLEFSNDFGCSIGTNMNPEEKCIIW